jgi:hypothetical protein
VVATIQAVAASVRELRKHKIHPHFVGYLCVLRAAAAADSWENIRVNFKQFFDDFLMYGNAPSERPYVIPFAPLKHAGIIFASNYPAGSYAPSSLRAGKAFMEVVSVLGRGADARYSLSDGHASAAFEHLLFGERLPVVPLAIFLYRDYGLTVPDTAVPEHEVFVEELRSEFGLATPADGMTIFDKLFEVDSSYLQDMVPITQPLGERGAR